MTPGRNVNVMPLTEPVKWHREIDGKLYHIIGRPSFTEKATGLTILCHGASIHRENTCIGVFPTTTFAFFADKWSKDQ
jgi:hypothetical protein